MINRMINGYRLNGNGGTARHQCRTSSHGSGLRVLLVLHPCDRRNYKNIVSLPRVWAFRKGTTFRLFSERI